jgi:predicted nucleotidyltransferase component of viral defense system
MKFDKEYIMNIARETNFIKDNIEKVLRLCSILNFIFSDTYLKDKLVLKGGTAINLFYANLPRLSVDIDLDFTLDINKDELVIYKENIKKTIIDYMVKEDFVLKNSTKEYYSLISLVFNYKNSVNNLDTIKIEINFMDRIHVLPLEIKNCNHYNNFICRDIIVLNPIELYASKINALISRAASRDIYDVYKMINLNIIKDYDLLKKCLIFYSMVGGEQNIDSINFSKIMNLSYHDIKLKLKPVLSKDDSFNYLDAKEVVINYINNLLNFDDCDYKFINEFRIKKYNPKLLFNEEIAHKLKNHPMAIWRCK